MNHSMHASRSNKPCYRGGEQNSCPSGFVDCSWPMCMNRGRVSLSNSLLKNLEGISIYLYTLCDVEKLFLYCMILQNVLFKWLQLSSKVYTPLSESAKFKFDQNKNDHTKMLENQRFYGSWRICLKNRQLICSGQTQLWIIQVTAQY